MKTLLFAIWKLTVALLCATIVGAVIVTVYGIVLLLVGLMFFK